MPTETLVEEDEDEEEEEEEEDDEVESNVALGGVDDVPEYDPVDNPRGFLLTTGACAIGIFEPCPDAASMNPKNGGDGL